MAVFPVLGALRQWLAMVSGPNGAMAEIPDIVMTSRTTGKQG